jgi:hypothetical protein
MLASSGPLIVGFIAEIYGYVERHEDINAMPEEIRIANRDALTRALFTVLQGTWILQILLYFVVYFTFPRDKQASQNEESAAAIVAYASPLGEAPNNPMLQEEPL